MIDGLKWTSTLPRKNFHQDETNNKIDSKIWINTIPKIKKDNSIKKYTTLSVLFVFILLSASITKNESRNLQKEINFLEKEIDGINYDIYKATLEYDVLSSPESISKLANDYLEKDLVTYKKSQIKKLSKFSEYKKKKSKIINKLEEKKVNLKEIKNIYKEPKKLPGKVSKKLTKMVNKQRSELKHLYENPNEIFKSEKIKKWAGLQIVKVFLGIPVVPGK